MIKSDLATPVVDPTAQLSEEHKKAAFDAGYGIPFLTDEAKFRMEIAARLAQAELPVREVK